MTAASSSPHAQAAHRMYGRRKGRPLRARKSRLMDELLPRVKIEPGFSDPHKLFDKRPSALWLEIGFGGGEHLAAQAKAQPTLGFIGCEPFINGVASLLDHIDREALTNVRVYPDDARSLIDVLPDDAIARCFILFADPWPKARHAERRFINPENVTRLARVMQKGAELRLASDDPGLIIWMRETMQVAKDFALLSDSPTPPVDWVPTRYEGKALKAGRKPVYFCYRRQ